MSLKEIEIPLNISENVRLWQYPKLSHIDLAKNDTTAVKRRLPANKCAKKKINVA